MLGTVSTAYKDGLYTTTDIRFPVQYYANCIKNPTNSVDNFHFQK